jgi:hypothetical protein
MKKLLFIFLCSTQIVFAQNPKVWTKEKANEWYAHQPFLTGADFLPSSAINQLEMWQAETFDTTTINRELTWAESLGFNTLRVFLHNLVWQEDAKGFKKEYIIFYKLLNVIISNPCLFFLMIVGTLNLLLVNNLIHNRGTQFRLDEKSRQNHA